MKWNYSRQKHNMFLLVIVFPLCFRWPLKSTRLQKPTLNLRCYPSFCSQATPCTIREPNAGKHVTEDMTYVQKLLRSDGPVTTPPQQLIPPLQPNTRSLCDQTKVHRDHKNCLHSLCVLVAGTTSCSVSWASLNIVIVQVTVDNYAYPS